MAKSVILYRDGGVFWWDALPPSFASVLVHHGNGTIAHARKTDYKSLKYLSATDRVRATRLYIPPREMAMRNVLYILAIYLFNLNGRPFVSSYCASI